VPKHVGVGTYHAVFYDLCFIVLHLVHFVG
jgi:hypothetical protein